MTNKHNIFPLFAAKTKLMQKQALLPISSSDLLELFYHYLLFHVTKVSHLISYSKYSLMP